MIGNILYSIIRIPYTTVKCASYTLLLLLLLLLHELLSGSLHQVGVYNMHT